MREPCDICGKPTTNDLDDSGSRYCRLCKEPIKIEAPRRKLFDRDRTFERPSGLKTEDVHVLARFFGFSSAGEFVQFINQQEETQREVQRRIQKRT